MSSTSSTCASTTTARRSWPAATRSSTSPRTWEAWGERGFFAFFFSLLLQLASSVVDLDLPFFFFFSHLLLIFPLPKNNNKHLNKNSFIQSNHSVIMYNNTMISFNMLEVARIADVKRFFYASSACIYPEYKQLDVEVEGGGLKEGDAWPAQPQDAYGEK